MNRLDRITRLIQNHFSVITLNVIDQSASHQGHQGHSGGEYTHLTIECQAREFSSLSRLDAQRAVNSLLQGEFDLGLHAISYKLS